MICSFSLDIDINMGRTFSLMKGKICPTVQTEIVGVLTLELERLLCSQSSLCNCTLSDSNTV